MMTGRLLPACLALLLPLGAARADDVPSLQELLRELRRGRAELFARRRDDVDRWMRELEEAGRAKVPADRPAALVRLEELGDEFAPLLLPWLEPGDTVERHVLYRARRVAQVLRGMRLEPVVEPLLALAEQGSLGALDVLGAAPETMRPAVFERLRQLYEGATEGPRRSRALTALVEIGGPGLEGVLRAALSARDDDLVAAALQALTEARAASALPQVVEFARGPASSAHVHALIDYFLIFDEVDEEDGAALLAIAGRSNLNLATRVAAVERMRKVAFDDRGEVRDVARELEQSSSSDLVEAVQVLLAYKGDSSARRDLLRRYDEIVDRDDKWARGYVQRGEIYYKIGDYKRALKDYREALELQANRSSDQEAFVGAARCQALLGNHKQAAEYLQRSPLSSATLRALGRDPDFAEMAADERYRGVFLLDEED